MDYTQEQIENITTYCKTYEAISYDELVDRFDNQLNETESELFGFDPAYILKEIDPTQYRCGLADFTDGLLSDGIISEDDAIEIDGEWYSEYDADEYL